MTTDAERANLFDAGITRMREKTDALEAFLQNAGSNHYTYWLDGSITNDTGDGSALYPIRTIANALAKVPHRSVINLLPKAGTPIVFNDIIDGVFARVDAKGCVINIRGDQTTRSKMLLTALTRTDSTTLANTAGLVANYAPAFLTLSDLDVETTAPTAPVGVLSSFTGVLSRGSGNRSQQFPLYLGLKNVKLKLSSPLFGTNVHPIDLSLDTVEIVKDIENPQNSWLLNGVYGASINIWSEGVVTLKKSDGTAATWADLIPPSMGMSLYVNNAKVV